MTTNAFSGLINPRTWDNPANLSNQFNHLLTTGALNLDEAGLLVDSLSQTDVVMPEGYDTWCENAQSIISNAGLVRDFFNNVSPEQLVNALRVMSERKTTHVLPSPDMGFMIFTESEGVVARAKAVLKVMNDNPDEIDVKKFSKLEESEMLNWIYSLARSDNSEDAISLCWRAINAGAKDYGFYTILMELEENRGNVEEADKVFYKMMKSSGIEDYNYVDIGDISIKGKTYEMAILNYLAAVYEYGFDINLIVKRIIWAIGGLYESQGGNNDASFEAKLDNARNEFSKRLPAKIVKLFDYCVKQYKKGFEFSQHPLSEKVYYYPRARVAFDEKKHMSLVDNAISREREKLNVFDESTSREEIIKSRDAIINMYRDETPSKKLILLIAEYESELGHHEQSQYLLRSLVLEEMVLEPMKIEYAQYCHKNGAYRLAIKYCAIALEDNDKQALNLLETVLSDYKASLGDDELFEEMMAYFDSRLLQEGAHDARLGFRKVLEVIK